MPKNIVDDLITDQEIVFAHGVMSGTMTDRQAAEAAGLNPDTAAYTKSKPRVRAYMQEHRAAVAAKLVDLYVRGTLSEFGADAVEILILAMFMPLLGAIAIVHDLARAAEMKSEADAVVAAYQRTLAAARAEAQAALKQSADRLAAEAAERQRALAASLAQEIQAA